MVLKTDYSPRIVFPATANIIIQLSCKNDLRQTWTKTALLPFFPNLTLWVYQVYNHILIILRKKFVRLRLQSWDKEDGLKGAKWKSISSTITSAHNKSNLFINSKNISLFWVWLNSEAKSVFFSSDSVFTAPPDRQTNRQTGGQTDRQTDGTA